MTKVIYAGNSTKHIYIRDSNKITVEINTVEFESMLQNAGVIILGVK